MALTPQSGKPKWADPNVPWKDDEAPPLMDMMRSDADIDRFHNREDQSPEAMAEAITQLQATVEVLTGRLAAVEEGAAGVVHAAKDLGTNMVKMGDALSKRVKDAEDEAEKAATEAASARAYATSARDALAAERSARQKTVRIAAIGAAVLTAVLAALIFFGPRPAATPAHASAPVLYSPSTPAN